ncbi:hypothetical protein D3C73_1475370 [compost metagenome]
MRGDQTDEADAARYRDTGADQPDTAQQQDLPLPAGGDANTFDAHFVKLQQIKHSRASPDDRRQNDQPGKRR